MEHHSFEFEFEKGDILHLHFYICITLWNFIKMHTWISKNNYMLCVSVYWNKCGNCTLNNTIQYNILYMEEYRKAQTKFSDYKSDWLTPWGILSWKLMKHQTCYCVIVIIIFIAIVFYSLLSSQFSVFSLNKIHLLWITRVDRILHLQVTSAY